MMDDTVPFPAAEVGEPERKPSRRRRGGARRHKSFGPGPAPAAEEAGGRRRADADGGRWRPRPPR